MVLIIIATLLVLGITFHQVVQGTFSALIMAVLTTLCAAAALSFYEPLASFLYERQSAYADAAALMALFIVPLLILRMIIDRFFRANLVLGVWTDRIFGGALGFYVGQIIAGMLLIALQMLPMGAEFLFYKPYDADLNRDQRVWPFRPDEFTLGWMNTLSLGGLGGERSYKSVHDDLLLELYCARNTAGKFGRVDAFPGAIAVEKAFLLPDSVPQGHFSYDVPANNRLPKKQLDRIYVIRVLVSDRVRGMDNWWRLPATHFRLVSDAGRSYYPVAYLRQEINLPPNTDYDFQGRTKDLAYVTPDVRRGQEQKYIWPRPVPQANPDEKDKAPRRAELIILNQWKEQGGPENLRVDWVFRLPDKEKPRELIFRRVARAQVMKAVEAKMPDPPTGPLQLRVRGR